jgi:hypothetical protein
LDDAANFERMASNMIAILQVASLVLVAIAMALALAHALEFPGKRRLDKATYAAVQTIYYPGFTMAGFAEVLAMPATLALLLLTPVGGAAFPLTAVAFAATVAMHAAYWVLTHPINRFWLEGQELGALGKGFFGLDPTKRGRQEGGDPWKRYRNRWEYSHVLRALLASAAFLALAVAAAL